jgi:hypothetical protein
VTKCPKCGGQKLKSLGIEKGERQDDFHTVLISKYKCKDCNAEFREIQTTEWTTEIAGREVPESQLPYEATIWQKLPNNRHRTKRIRFHVPDKSRQIFFANHPEYKKPGYFVTISFFSHMNCVSYFPGQIGHLDSMIAYIQRTFPDAKERKWLTEHLVAYAKNIEQGLDKVGA